jgi:hypothetical protein
MRVLFKTEGGFANFPGLSKPVIVDTNELPPEESRELERLIESANLFDQTASPPEPLRTRDHRQYTISVTAPGRSHTARFADPIEDPRVGELVRYLSAKARESRESQRRPPSNS